MKRFGYTPAFAGGVEATASMGGQIMPPVMGAVAFIMAETINVPYVEICKAAIIPALLYFARRSGWCTWRPGARACIGLPKEAVPEPLDGACASAGTCCCRSSASSYLLFSGYTPLFCRHGRPRADRRADLRRRRARRASASGRCVAVLGAAWPCAAQAFFEFGIESRSSCMIAMLVAAILLRRKRRR